MSAAETTLLFLHVPKTAGISISTALATKFPEHGMFHIRSATHELAPKFSRHYGPEAEFRALPLAQRGNFRCVLGHFQYGLHDAIPGKAQYFTLLRNPLERYVSQVAQYNRMVAAGEFGPDARQATLQEYRSVRPAHFANPQTRWVSGLTEGQLASLSAEQTLAIAKRNLAEHFCVVGAVERMDDSLEILTRVRGWETLPIGRENASKVRPSCDEFTAAEREEFEANNQLDWQLWQMAFERLDAAFDEIPRVATTRPKVFAFRRLTQAITRRRAA